MTSARFDTLKPDNIVVEPDRQRKKLTNIDELAGSINKRGLINPIVVTAEGVLVAGERRLTACKQLGWTSIPVQYVEDLSEYELQCIEFEENIQREDLTWQEEVEAIARFHKLKADNEETWSQQDTANALTMSQKDVSRKLSVADKMDDEAIASADRFSAAHNMVQRNKERAKASAIKEIKAAPIVRNPEVEAILEKSEAKYDDLPEYPIQLGDFNEWQKSYDGPKFNLLHCDFPYGINVADAPRMASSIKDHYEDSPDIYWTLVNTLHNAMQNVVADSAHLIFWHSMKFHRQTVAALTDMGWKVNPFPLIWHKSDNAGIAPDPQRGPRQTYEAAIFATRGDRKLTSAGCLSNSFAYPGKRSADSIHVSEKPYKMLHHFLRMVCDEYSIVLDPTAGSGNALKVAEDLGAKHILGLEKSQEFLANAEASWEQRDG